MKSNQPIATVQQAPTPQELAQSVFNSTLFPLIKSPIGLMIIALLVVMPIAAVVDGSTRKGVLAHARWGGRREQLRAVRIAKRQVKDNKYNRITLFVGKPKSLKGFKAEFDALAGKDRNTPILTNVQQGVIVLGAPNSGKTFSLIDPAIRDAIRRGFSIIVLALKGDQIKSHAAYAASMGYEVEIFAPGFPYTSTVNLVDLLKDPGDSLMSGQIGLVIKKNSDAGAKEDAFFGPAGSSTLSGCIQMAKASKYPDMLMAYVICRLPGLADRLAYAKERETLDPFIEPSFQFVLSSRGSDRQLSGIIATAQQAFRFFSHRDLIPCTMGSGLTLDLTGKQILFLQLDIERQDSIAPLIAAVIQCLVTRNLAQPRGAFDPPRPPLILSLDEVASGVYLPDLGKWINFFRSYGLGTIVGGQHLAQFRMLYGQDGAENLIAGCGTKVFFNPRHPATADFVSKYLGSKEVISHSRSRSSGKGGSSRSSQPHSVPLLPSEDILLFSEGECVFVNPGYQRGKDASIPMRMKVHIPEEEIAIQRRSEELWPLLEQRLIEKNAAKLPSEDAIREAIAMRQREAELMLPMPPEEDEEEPPLYIYQAHQAEQQASVTEEESEENEEAPEGASEEDLAEFHAIV